MIAGTLRTNPLILRYMYIHCTRQANVFNDILALNKNVQDVCMETRNTCIHVQVHMYVYMFMLFIYSKLCIFVDDERANKLDTDVQGSLACLAPPWQFFMYRYMYKYTFMYICIHVSLRELHLVQHLYTSSSVGSWSTCLYRTCDVMGLSPATCILLWVQLHWVQLQLFSGKKACVCCVALISECPRCHVHCTWLYMYVKMHIHVHVLPWWLSSPPPFIFYGCKGQRINHKGRKRLHVG